MTNERRGTDLLYELIAEARGYPDSIVLGRGDPDFDTPPHIIAAARQAMLKHANDHTPPEGILPLRQAIAERVRRVNNIDVDPETEVVVTNGGQEALFLMVVAVIGEGDELLVPEPNYNTYNDALHFARGVKVGVPTYAQENFRVDPKRMRQAITERTRAMLLVSPNNPSASVIAPDDVCELVKIAQKNDLMILADDIYDLFIYDDYVHLSPASLPGGKERTLTLNALSKAFAMTGWRVGWIVGPADLMAQVRQLKAAVTGATSIIAQYAALAALTGPQDAVNEMRQAYARRRRMVLDALDSMGIRYGVPQGGQFLFADIGFAGMSSVELAQKILTEQHVLVYPGSAFARDKEWDNYLRITFLQPEEKLREGLERMKLAMDRILATR
ncbi:MAG: aminotransferase class I/II-fold pyridoxal phosphate-dependent enzyme [Chloroflexi bacterium]|nr:aminotransferase class I/II-fold pyridoxal phosphate-dependent enzyme [Chloroflexota bacterium]